MLSNKSALYLVDRQIRQSGRTRPTEVILAIYFATGRFSVDRGIGLSDTTYMKQAFWTDAAGTTHKVNIIEVRQSQTLIEYFDNRPEARGVTWKHGRKYSHGTRVRLLVWHNELKVI